jgi:hypothetical protein
VGKGTHLFTGLKKIAFEPILDLWVKKTLNKRLRADYMCAFMCDLHANCTCNLVYL